MEAWRKVDNRSTTMGAVDLGWEKNSPNRSEWEAGEPYVVRGSGKNQEADARGTSYNWHWAAGAGMASQMHFL